MGEHSQDNGANTGWTDRLITSKRAIGALLVTAVLAGGTAGVVGAVLRDNAPNYPGTGPEMSLDDELRDAYDKFDISNVRDLHTVEAGREQISFHLDAVENQDTANAKGPGYVLEDPSYTVTREGGTPLEGPSVDFDAKTGVSTVGIETGNFVSHEPTTVTVDVIGKVKENDFSDGDRLVATHDGGSFTVTGHDGQVTNVVEMPDTAPHELPEIVTEQVPVS